MDNDDVKCTTCNDSGYVCDNCRLPEDECECQTPEMVECDVCPEDE